MTIFTINGADKFEFEIGGNSTNGELGIKKNSKNHLNNKPITNKYKTYRFSGFHIFL